MQQTSKPAFLFHRVSSDGDGRHIRTAKLDEDDVIEWSCMSRVNIVNLGFPHMHGQ